MNLAKSEPRLPEIDAALIKVTGVFSFHKKQIDSFYSIGFANTPLSENLPEKDVVEYESLCAKQIANEQKFLKDTYYNEFASLMFTGEDNDHPMVSLKRTKTFPVTLYLPGKFGRREILASCTHQELYLFNNEIGIFALTFSPSKFDFLEISNLTVAIKNFDTSIDFGELEMTLHEFISKNILNNIKLRGSQVESDTFSGSKFKVYSVINIKEDNGKDDLYSTENLVYEIGTGSQIFTIFNSYSNAPTQEYREELMKNSIRVFKNYIGLALLDSFTIIGHGVFSGENYKTITDPAVRNMAYNKYNSYNRIYFSIYILNIYIRYNVFRFNSIFKTDPIKTRNEFVDFINNYNFSHISFNFLPNIFYQRIHQALGIDEEVRLFEKRLGSLANEIQESQNKRQGIFLGIISIITGLGSSTEILALMEEARIYIQWSQIKFYTAMISIIIIASIPTLQFLYPRQVKRIKDGLTRKWSNK